MASATQSLTCPACGKSNSLDTGGSREEETCRRCGSDLAPLAGLTRATAERKKAVAACIRNGRWEQALTEARRAWRLQHSPEIAAMACVAAVALGDHHALGQWYPFTEKGED